MNLHKGFLFSVILIGCFSFLGARGTVEEFQRDYPLHYAAARDDAATVAQLLDEGVHGINSVARCHIEQLEDGSWSEPVEDSGCEDMSSILVAVYCGSLNALGVLLDRGAFPFSVSQSESGEIKMHVAALAFKTDDVGVLQLFLERDPDFLLHKVQCGEVHVPLFFYAVLDGLQTKKDRCLQEMLRRDASIVNATIEPVGDTVLHFAAKKNCLPLARKAVELGAKVEARNEEEETPLIVILKIASREKSEVARFLIDECHADLTAACKSGTSAVTWEELSRMKEQAIEALRRMGIRL
jgi:ankyrin repeat protein